MEPLRRRDANHAIRLLLQLPPGIASGNRDRDEQPSRGRTQSPSCGSHCGSRGQAVVDKDDRAALKPSGRTFIAKDGLAPFDLPPLAGHHKVDGLPRDAVRADHVLLQHDAAAAGYRAHGQLFLPGDTEFANDEDVEGQMQIASDLESNRHSTARQAEDNRVSCGKVVGAFFTNDPSKRATRVPAILKEVDHSKPSLALFATQARGAMASWNLCGRVAYSETAVESPSS